MTEPVDRARVEEVSPALRGARLVAPGIAGATVAEKGRVDSGPFNVGEVLGDAYEIIAPLGTGGMGIVYEARDLLLGRRVAIKVAKDDASADALRNEARALAAVHNANLVGVYAAGRHLGNDYIVMELLRGQTLEERMERAIRGGQTIPLDEAIDLLIAVTSALSSLHSLGVAHRDLKPGNVVLAGGRVVLIDLGLFIPEFEVSGDNVVGGSPEYVAPEVLKRAVEPGGGHLVDLYALGILGFELLTGKPPFYGRDVPRIVAQHVSERVPDVRTIRHDVPAKLAALLADLVEKDPSDRVPNSEAALWRLEEIRDGGRQAGRNLRVLVIDDDPVVGDVLRRSLEAALPGLAVMTATDPRVAVAAVERSPVDIVAVDLHMPRMNGVEVCMQLAGLPDEVRPAIIAMSAEAEPRDVDVFKRLGAVRFVPKDYRFVGAVCDAVGTIRRGRRAT